MFRFENENYLYGLLIIGILIILYVILNIRDKKRLSRYGEPGILSKLMSSRSKSMKNLKFSLLMTCLAFFIVALANPQVGSTLEKGTRKGVDIMVCMDVSNSMLAEDIQPNRLEASKMAMSNFVDRLQGDRIGLVVFAGTSFVQLPITSDYAAAKMFINSVNTGMINVQGTDIASALDLAAVSMLPEKTDENNSTLSDLTSKVIIVVSDGEDHFQEATQMASKVNRKGILVHTIGIGSSRGEPIPIRNRNGTVTYKKDKDGNTVMTRLNETSLRDIASAGKGVYIHANNANMGFEAITDEINKMYKSDIEEVTFSRYESRFQIPLAIGLILLVIESFLFSVKPKWIKRLMENTNVTAKISLFILIFSAGGYTLEAQTNNELKAIRQGNKEFNEAEKLRRDAMDLMESGKQLDQGEAQNKLKEASSKYQQAEVDYRKSMETNKNYDKGNYNLGASLYRQEKYEDAAGIFRNIAENQSIDPKLRSQSYHNLGNSLMKQEKYQESIEAYKHALKLNPSDMDTKYNLEYARKKLIQQQNQQRQQQKNPDNQQQEQKNQKGKQQSQEQSGGDGQNRRNQQPSHPQQQDSPDQQQQEKDAAGQQQRNSDKRQLDALQQNERKTQEKIQRREMQSGKKVKQDKDW